MAHANPVAEPMVFYGSAADRRLMQLNVPIERLNAALDAGDVAARQADEFSPVTAAGSLRWMETVRMLRQGLAADEWTLNDDRNSPRVIAPSGRLAIVPVSGSADTGLIDGTPRTLNPRGEASSRAVQMNGQLVLDLGGEGLLPDMSAEKLASVATYYLLYYRSQGDLLRAELSLPVSITDKGLVVGWRERILLPPRTFGAEEVLPRDAGDDDDVEFDIAAR